MTRHSYDCWLHGRTGEFWAVTLDEEDRVIRACGPLAAQEINLGLLPYLPYTAAAGKWVQRHRRHFRSWAAMTPSGNHMRDSSSAPDVSEATPHRRTAIG